MSGKDILFMRSIKKKTKLGSDSTSMTEDDIWDDSVLVEAYNKAVDHAHSKVLKNLPIIPPKQRMTTGNIAQKNNWAVGDHCSCEFSEDHIYYEADIVGIIDDLDMCIVKYVGYENEEKVPMSKLKASKGGMARSLQIKQAYLEKGVMGGSGPNKPGSSNLSQAGKKKIIPKKSENEKGNETTLGEDMDSQEFNPPLAGSIPPPPPPQMFIKLDDNVPESDAMSAMLMSWYMSGYHTGYYQGLKAAKK